MLGDVHLSDDAGTFLDLHVAGYQFPDAEDLGQRFSWHVVEGSATADDGQWDFRYPALSCDESPRVSAWLRATARRLSSPATVFRSPRTSDVLTFTEPNLSLAYTGQTDGLADIEVSLDLEFAPPWHRQQQAGTPFVLRFPLSCDRLKRVADEWDEERSPYPDGPTS